MTAQPPDHIAPDERSLTRRTLVLGTALTAAGGAASLPPAASAQTATAAGATGAPKPYELPPLPYAHDALEPEIDRETMQLHHDRHHRAYVDALNRALQPHPDLQGRAIEALLRGLDGVPAPIRETVRNNGGGHANHQMFWTIMQPGGAKQPAGAVLDAINGSFGSFEGFRQRFEEAGLRQFGSGWVFLVTRPGARGLEILALPNQDSPAMQGRHVLLGNDVWEHAYYLKHRNRRADYLRGWWPVVNWTAVGARLDAAPA